MKIIRRHQVNFEMCGISEERIVQFMRCNYALRYQLTRYLLENNYGLDHTRCNRPAFWLRSNDVHRYPLSFKSRTKKGALGSFFFVSCLDSTKTKGISLTNPQASVEM